MSPEKTDFGLVLANLERFSVACGTREAAAKRLGVAKGTLTKWFAKRTIGVGSLQNLAAFEGDAELAKAARDVLVDSGSEIASFNFGHIAAQLMCLGPSACMLFQMLERNSPLEDLEFGAAHDLVCGFADMQYYNALSEVAQDSFQELPHSPLPRLGHADYERDVFPDEDELDEAGAEIEIDRSKINWEKINEPYRRRSDAAHHIFDCARDEAPHRLFDQIIDTLYCRVRKREPDGRDFSKEECLRIAAHAAADYYKLESAVMEAADTIRCAANTHPALAARPLYRLATKFYEICYLSRTFSINRLTALINMLGEDTKTIEQVQGICAFVQHALYSAKGVHFFQPGFASAQVNAHGAVIDYESGSVVRSLVGKKRKAPKRAIVRDASVPRRPRRRLRAPQQSI